MTSNQHQGQLVIIGGAEDRDGECKILREFVRCAGGMEAKIVVMTVATELPREVGEDYIRVFERLGIKNIRIIDTIQREDAETSTVLEAINNATGVFFTGGDQARITEILKDSALHQALLKRYTEGLVVGGTSAGASMMSTNMILEGEGQTHPRIEIVEMDQGMSFFPEAVIDQHFAQRGRLGRLLTAVARHPDLIGIGIDENTAIVVRDHQFYVVGDGSCTIVDLSEITHNNIGQLLRDEGLALSGVKLHILPEGYKFDLHNRQTVTGNEPVNTPEMATVS
ncbi:cyanophycinase [Limnoraphis robusta]|uniref:Cyanophycinase n=1 Tax=Limnoraphis robusta CCNP1315 TaxID=3110306 RepID=A0ABU5TUW5_9CYAN|nr:cyanophycinase [Limnoraphis robusta]MEA5518690.1 cyanophycinase [Limnoraphis robusta CCNP1315]MEA5544989.1 cyanophycinase [Limnoraphis robusta CCNP1324]